MPHSRCLVVTFLAIAFILGLLYISSPRSVTTVSSSPSLLTSKPSPSTSGSNGNHRHSLRPRPSPASDSTAPSSSASSPLPKSGVPSRDDEVVSPTFVQQQPPPNTDDATTGRPLIWRPTHCGTIYNDNASSRVYLRHLFEGGTKLSDARLRGVKSQRTGREGDVYCAAWDGGVFLPAPVDMTKQLLSQKREELQRDAVDDFVKSAGGTENEAATLLRQLSATPPPVVWAQNKRPDVFSDGEGKRLPPLDHCSVGTCLADLIARRVRDMSSQDKDAQSSPPPRWLLFVGDSRFRHMLARLITMVRSQFFVGGSNGAISTPEEAAFFEMRRPGVVEHYFHLNATYMVWGRRRRDRNQKAGIIESFQATRDRLNVIPEGQGCVDDDVAMMRGKQAAADENSNNNKDGEEEVVLFRICLWWHVSSQRLNEEGPWILEQLRPTAVGWMPTLHECMGRNRRGKSGGKYTRCLVDPRNMVGVAKKAVMDVAAATSAIRNFVLLTSPNSQLAPPRVIGHRNKAFVSGFDQGSQARLNMMKNKEQEQPHHDESLTATSATTTKKPHTNPTWSSLVSLREVVDREQNSNNITSATRPRKLEQWLIDLAAWWYVQQPKLCDFTHSMCNLKPHRPMAANAVTFFCNGCRDEIGFVGVQEFLRVLLA